MKERKEKEDKEIELFLSSNYKIKHKIFKYIKSNN
jgi:hypothetical protein